MEDVEDTTYTACWVPGTTDPRRYRVVNQVDSNGPTGYIEEHWRSDIRFYLVFDPDDRLVDENGMASRLIAVRCLHQDSHVEAE